MLHGYMAVIYGII